jgi:hypothetical protein
LGGLGVSQVRLTVLLQSNSKDSFSNLVGRTIYLHINNEKTYLAICATTLVITITTSAMGAERVLNCFYDNPNSKDKSVNIFVDEEKSTVIHNYQNTKGYGEHRMKITFVYNEWIYANNSQGL